MDFMEQYQKLVDLSIEVDKFNLTKERASLAPRQQERLVQLKTHLDNARWECRKLMQETQGENQ